MKRYRVLMPRLLCLGIQQNCALLTLHHSFADGSGAQMAAGYEGLGKGGR